MRKAIFVFSIALAACGGSHSNNKLDASGCGSQCDAPNDIGGGPTTITLTLTNHPTNTAMFSFVVAYQDGSGPWTVAPAPTGDVYTFTVNAAAYGVAWTCIGINGATREVNTRYFSVAERTSFTEVIPGRCTQLMMPVILSGAVSNPPNTGTVDLGFGFARVTATRAGGGGDTYAFDGIQPATHDLIAGNNVLGGVSTTDLLVQSATIQRSLAVTANTTQAVDFSTAQTAASASVSGVPTGANTRPNVSTVLVSAGGTVYTFVVQTVPITNMFFTRGLATAQAATGDIYNQQVRVDDTTAGSTSIVQSWNTSIAAQAYTAPAALGGATSMVTTTTPYPLIKSTWLAYTGTIGYVWDARQQQSGSVCNPAPACAVTWTAALSPGYVGASPVEQMPDLSQLAGWDSRLQFVTGTLVNGHVTATTSSVGASDFPTFPLPPAGTSRTLVSSGWSVTP